MCQTPIDCRLDDRVRGISKIHYGPAIRPIDALPPPRHVHPPLPTLSGRRLFSRTIDPPDGTFAINELLPVRHRPVTASRRVPSGAPRDLFDPEGNFVREQNRGRERNEGETFVTAFSGAPLLRGERAR